MTLPIEPALHKLQFYVTTPYKCGYLPNKMAQSLIAAPHHLVDTNVYNGLIEQGFRRSGKFAYRPHCENCKACIAIRVILDEFTPSRSQKRAYKQHANLTVRVLPLGYQQQHFELYTSYQKLRHADEDLSQQAEAHRTAEIQTEADQYRQFLCKSNVESLMVEFSDAGGAVKIVSVIDVVNDGISAVYTFYDALEARASFGTYSIMWLAEWAKMLGLPYLYLGYWIEASPKMAYKQQFKPQQKLIEGEWL
jgi:leucyl-tRNA---protein transferase